MRELLLAKFLSLVLLLANFQTVFAQEKERINNPGEQALQNDSSFFIGGVSISLLPKGQLEINTLNTFNSFQIGVNESVETSPFIDRLRVTDFSTRLDSYVGMSEKGRWDIGLRIEYGRRRVDNNASASPADVFLPYEDSDSIRVTDFGRSYGGITRVGLRFRLKPFAKNPDWTLFGGYAVGAIKSPEFQQNLQTQTDRADLSLVYAHDVSRRVYYYVAISGIWEPSNRVDTLSNYQSSLAFYLVNLAMNNKLVFYPGLAFSISGEPVLTPDGKRLAWTSRSFLGFIGLQYQINRRFLLSGTYNIPITNELSNQRFELITQSQTTGTLSARFLF